ncbi:hypothetical protein [Bacillus cereus]|uniref:hypothetical protein n=1 Tax=Bacillus cereus TaxID=1396 RepID=UPI0035C9F28A
MNKAKGTKIKFLSENMSNESVRLNPDGLSAVEIGFPVVEEGTNKPVPNVKVTISVIPIRPDGAEWRTEQGVVNQYPVESQEIIRGRIRSGEIKLIGPLSATEVITDADGIAKVRYTASHIGGNQDEIGQEKIVASLENGSTSEFIVNLGYENLVEIPIVDKGLRIQNSRGKYIHTELAPFLKNIGEEIKRVGWPVPMTISAGTFKWGGLYPPHKAHRGGAEFDIWTMATDGNAAYSYKSPKYDRAKTQALVNVFKDAGATKILFNDPDVTGVSGSDKSHDNHLHVSFARNTLTGEIKVNNVICDF